MDDTCFSLTFWCDEIMHVHLMSLIELEEGYAMQSAYFMMRVRAVVTASSGFVLDRGGV